MLFQLLGAIILGVGMAGVVMIAFRLVGRKAPRWTLPVFAGAAMLGFQIWNEYTWFSRTAAALPAHIVLAGTYSSSSPLQPWTMLVPPVDRFSVIDARSIRRNERAPHLRMIEVFLIGRYMPTASTIQIYDCETPRRADVVRTLEFDADGRPTGAQWIDLDAADPLRRKVCTHDLAGNPRGIHGAAAPEVREIADVARQGSGVATGS